jgi:hypothetical protein
MKKVVDTKKTLFENMAKLNPDFKLKEETKPEVKPEGKKEVITEDKKWIQKAVDPAHKGFCTPMTKSTCTPSRKALAKRFKKGIDENGIDGEPVEMSTEEKYEELVSLVDNMYDLIHGEEEETPEEEPVEEPGEEETPEGEIENEAYGVPEPLGKSMAKPLNEK